MCSEFFAKSIQVLIDLFSKFSNALTINPFTTSIRLNSIPGYLQVLPLIYLVTHEWTFFASVGLSQYASLLGWRCTGFSLMELLLLYTFTHWFSFSSQPPSPAHSAADYSVTRLSPRVLVLFGCPTTGRAPLATSLPLIGLLPAEPPADPASSPGVTTLFFRTVPSANTSGSDG